MAAVEITPLMHEQLAAIEAISGDLDEHGIEHWLFGGWAVDFWAGAPTREHGDIDIAAWHEDRGAVGAALERAGWRHTPAEDEAVGARYLRGPVLAEFTFVVADAAGAVFLPFAEGPIRWSAKPFGHDRRELHGVSCRVIPLPVLTAGKASPRTEAAEAAKDRADFEVLSRL